MRRRWARTWSDPAWGLRSVEVPSHGSVSFDGSEPTAGVPCQPLVESVVAGDQQVTVRWAPACADPRAPITAYRIVARTDAAEDPVKTFEAPANATEAVITGLANGTAHHVTVAAVNSCRSEPDRAHGRLRRSRRSARPRRRSAWLPSSPFPGAIHLEWTKPVTDGGKSITSYRAGIFRDAAGDEPTSRKPGGAAPGHRPATTGWA